MDLWLGSRSTQAAGFGSLGTSSHQHPTFPHFTAQKISISDRKHLMATKSPDTLMTPVHALLNPKHLPWVPQGTRRGQSSQIASNMPSTP